MILTGLILGAVLTTAAIGTIAYFWNEITSWLKRAIAKVKEIVSGIVYGTKVLAKKLDEGLKEISKHYSKNGTQWEETTVTKTIPESEVPPEILAKVGYSETDLTDDYQEVLELHVS